MKTPIRYNDLGPDKLIPVTSNIPQQTSLTVAVKLQLIR